MQKMHSQTSADRFMQAGASNNILFIACPKKIVDLNKYQGILMTEIQI